MGRFGDFAAELFLRNEAVVTRLESFFEAVTDKVIDTGSAADIERLRENLEVVMATDDFLGRLPSLVNFSDRLIPAE